VGQKLQKQIRNPGLLTLSGNGETQRDQDCCNCSMLSHTHSPEGHLLLGSRSARGLCSSEFYEDNAGAAQLREEINYSNAP